MPDKTPKLITERPLPDRTRRGGESKYVPIVREFNESAAETGFVEVQGVAFQAISSGLKTAIAQMGLSDVLGVTTRASEGVWLVKNKNKNKK